MSHADREALKEALGGPLVSLFQGAVNLEKYDSAQSWALEIERKALEQVEAWGRLREHASELAAITGKLHDG